MMRIGSLFTGSGQLDAAALALFPAASVAWHCEVDPAASRVLAHHWPEVPNVGDVTAIDWATVEPVDIITGGFPCQDVSTAGPKAGLITGTRSGLWSYMCDAIAVHRPRSVLIENVRGLLSANAVRHVEPGPDALGDNDFEPVLRALGAVLGDLAALGFDADWGCVRASDVGACHHRARVFVHAYPADGPARPVGTTPRYGDPVIGPHLPTPDTGVSPNGHGRRGGTAGNGFQSGIGLDAVVRALEVPGAAAPRRGWCPAPAEWGRYAPVIRRQERWTRPAPPPLERNSTGRQRLSAAFAEWMMCWPQGWATAPGLGLTRLEQLHVIGNGVCPPQAIAAFRVLLGVAA